MLTEVTFSMDAHTRAHDVVGVWLLTRTARFSPQWVERGDRMYVTLTVTTSVVDAVVEKVCKLNRGVRCIRLEPVDAAS